MGRTTIGGILPEKMGLNFFRDNIRFRNSNLEKQLDLALWDYTNTLVADNNIKILTT